LSAKARRVSDVRMSDDFFIPVAINGKPAKYGFDSGMDISFISEAEANRLRLPIHEVSASSLRDGASGNDVPVRFCVAARLAVGGIELRHVVFLVARTARCRLSSCRGTNRVSSVFPCLWPSEPCDGG